MVEAILRKVISYAMHNMHILYVILADIFHA